MPLTTRPSSYTSRPSRRRDFCKLNRLPVSRSKQGQVAQLVEQRTENPCVGGSIPSLATKYSSTYKAAPASSKDLAGVLRELSHQSPAQHHQLWPSLARFTYTICRFDKLGKFSGGIVRCDSR
jgi:hypothetical protein